MSHKTGNMVFIKKEPDSICELCGKIAETRPYGPKGERICFACGMKNEKTTNKMFEKFLNE